MQKTYLGPESFWAAEEINAASSCRTCATTTIASSACFHCLSLYRFADSGHGLDSVSGIKARGVELVPEPGAIGQSRCIREFALTIHEHFVDFGDRGAASAAPPFAFVTSSAL